MTKKLEIIRDVTVRIVVPFSDEYYPCANTIEEAMQYEKDIMDPKSDNYDDAWMETFFEDEIISTDITINVIDEDNEDDDASI